MIRLTLLESIYNGTRLTASPLPFELNLIGLHVDEAIAELDRYLDKAILANKERIKVIHGFGTGALRNAVHAYLKKSKFVKSYKLGGEFDGGLGSTIVVLKWQKNWDNWSIIYQPNQVVI